MANTKRYLDEADLMKRIAQKDQQAFRIIFERESAGLFRIAFIYLKDELLAQDAVQESFTKLWLKAEGWTPDASIKTWLITITRNVCIDVLRKNKNDQKKKNDLLAEGLSIQSYAGETPAFRKLQQEKAQNSLKSAIFLLPERQREALSLVYYMECSGSEAAEIMGLTLVALESLLARARRRLRKELQIQKSDLLGGYHGS
jgi:RNA polymerase sigma-70 factor (ECF subfamily)